jgi:hypothetical protein
MYWLSRLWSFIQESLEALRDEDQEAAARNEQEFALPQERWLDYLSPPQK